MLQGVQGLLLNFHVAAQKIPPDDASRGMLDRSLATADRIILEGRNRVSSLRSEQLTDGELVASLENAGTDLRSDSEVEFSVNRSGSDATLHSPVADEIFWIAREALTNAFRHAGASRISVELNYAGRYFRMVCTDNGRGLDATTARSRVVGDCEDDRTRTQARRALAGPERSRQRHSNHRVSAVVSSLPESLQVHVLRPRPAVHLCRQTAMNPPAMNVAIRFFTASKSSDLQSHRTACRFVRCARA